MFLDPPNSPRKIPKVLPLDQFRVGKISMPRSPPGFSPCKKGAPWPPGFRRRPMVMMNSFLMSPCPLRDPGLVGGDWNIGDTLW